MCIALDVLQPLLEAESPDVDEQRRVGLALERRSEREQFVQCQCSVV
jgi:hypothetical protein